MTSFAFHTNEKQHLDTLHKQKKKEMHLRMHNNDFDMLLRSVNYSAKLQIEKIHKNIQIIKYYLNKTSWEFEFSKYGIHDFDPLKYVVQQLKKSYITYAAG